MNCCHPPCIRMAAVDEKELKTHSPSMRCIFYLPPSLVTLATSPSGSNPHTINAGTEKQNTIATNGLLFSLCERERDPEDTVASKLTNQKRKCWVGKPALGVHGLAEQV